MQEKCDLCRKECDKADLIAGHSIRREIVSLIVKDHPGWDAGMSICRDDYNRYRMKYISSIIEEETGNIRDLERDVLHSIEENEFVSANINAKAEETLRAGDKIADKVASFGGSWTFILIFFGLLFSWIAVNTYILVTKPFDPFPFILLNLILSCLAAIQAPIIMMSQNRQEIKDRLRAENDYKINLKAEIEIRTLHEKVDHLLLDQWSKMIEIQQMQIEILEEIKERVEAGK